MQRSIYRRSSISILVFLCLRMHGVSQVLEHRNETPPAAPPAESRPVGPPTLEAGTPFQVEITRSYPMKAGESIEGRLVYALYAAGKLAVPAGTPVHGTVVRLDPDRKQRWHGRLLGDFTPFHTPEVKFDQLMMQDGGRALSTAEATTGAPVLRLVAPGARPKQSLVAREWAVAKDRVHEQVAFFTDPGFGDRAKQILYHQLPYHPEQIAAHTAWTVELAAPLVLAADAGGMPVSQAAVPSKPGAPEVWVVRAALSAEVSSATAKPGDAVRALVLEPVWDKDNQLVVPQGSQLIGKVTTAKAARSLGRNGKLRFTFQQIRFPEGFGAPVPDRPVEGALAGALTQGQNGLNLDAEGTITPKNQSSALVPLALTFLAGRALDDDGSVFAHNAVASNGFGMVGRVVGIASGSPAVGAGLGFYAAGLSVYQNFLTHGHDVIFPKNTRIEIETTPLRAPVLKPAAP